MLLGLPLFLCTLHDCPWYLHVSCSPTAPSSQQAQKSEPRGLLSGEQSGVGGTPMPTESLRATRVDAAARPCAHPSNSPPGSSPPLYSPGGCRGPGHHPFMMGRAGSGKAVACSGRSGSGTSRCLGTDDDSTSHLYPHPPMPGA